MASLRQSLWLAFAVVLAFLCQVLNAADFSQRHEPQGKLKVRLDYDLANRDKRDFEGGHQWVFSTHITFKGSVEDITARQLKKLAADAYEEMEVDILQYKPRMDKKKGTPRMLPGVVTILAAGKEVFLSSSQKGQVAFINEVDDSPVKKQMELCLAIWADFNINPEKPDHKNGRKCGEVMAFHQYYQVHPDQDLAKLSPLARGGTVHRISGNLVIIPPCGTDAEVSELIKGWVLDQWKVTDCDTGPLGLQSVFAECRWTRPSHGLPALGYRRRRL